ncbi:MAG: DUF5947 family protein [Candidatus Rokuibacteriota bacterium]
MTVTAPATAFGALREFARPRPAVDRCELCAAELGPAHEHLLDPGARQLRCSCVACGRLLCGTPGAPWKLVRHRVERLPHLRLTDEEWRMLALPIELAFFVRSSAAGRVMALYPSAGGTIESSLPLPAWDALVGANPLLADLQPDVEALLVNRTGRRRDHYLVSIDECYQLTGLMRLRWQGFGGGEEVWAEIGRFFADLDARSGAP